MTRSHSLFLCLCLFAAPEAAISGSSSGYVLGADDVLAIRVLDLEEFASTNLGAVRIDPDGNIRLPIAGRIHAAGRTVEALEAEIAKRLRTVVQEPEVTVAIGEFRSHSVSVLGAVKNPGVHQIAGKRTLFEVLSLAGGLASDAGNMIKITRRVSEGPLPLENVTPDTSGDFLVGELDIREVMEARNPAQNIPVVSNDVITVPKADLVYVIGAVRRSGGFVLSEKREMTVLQALSLSEGLERVAAPKDARILRQRTPGAERTEIPINLTDILKGKTRDIALRANDILFVPNSASKSAAIRTLEAAIQLGTGVVIYRR
jgi:polysaccharide export outer membrane protein